MLNIDNKPCCGNMMRLEESKNIYVWRVCVLLVGCVLFVDASFYSKWKDDERWPRVVNMLDLLSIEQNVIVSRMVKYVYYLVCVCC